MSSFIARRVMSYSVVRSRLWGPALCGALLTGCVLPVTFLPVEGPLASQHPVPVYTAFLPGGIPGGSPGHLVIALDKGEVFEGYWHRVAPPNGTSSSGKSPVAAVAPAPAEESGVNLTPDWDALYGAGYFASHVRVSWQHWRASLLGSAGSTAVIEACSHGKCGRTAGVARDSHNNVYKVTVHVPGLSCPQTVADTDSDSLPTLVLPATGGSPVLAIPLGGASYLPVTGGQPITGTPFR